MQTDNMLVAIMAENMQFFLGDKRPESAIPAFTLPDEINAAARTVFKQGIAVQFELHRYEIFFSIVMESFFHCDPFFGHSACIAGLIAYGARLIGFLTAGFLRLFPVGILILGFIQSYMNTHDYNRIEK